MSIDQRMKAALLELQAAKNIYDEAKERLMRAADVVTRIECETEEATILQGLRVCQPTEVLTISRELINAYDAKRKQCMQVDGEWWSHDVGEPFYRGRMPETVSA